MKKPPATTIPFGVDSPGKILLVKPSSLGDIVHALPVVSELRRHFGASRISWLVNTSLMDMARASPYVDEIIPFDRDSWRGFLSLLVNGMGFFGLCARLRAERYDLVLDLQGLFRSAFLSRVSNAPVRVGFFNARELGYIFYNARVRLGSNKLHAVDRYLFTLRRIGIEPGKPDFAMKVDASAMQRVEDLLGRAHWDRAGPLVVASPFTRWPTKDWPAEYYAKVLGEIRRRWGARIVIDASVAEASRADKLAVEVGSGTLNLAGKTTLAQMIALLSRAKLLLTGDSGPMHVADALGTPLVAFFGPTDPGRTGPYLQRDAVLQAAVPCVPCFSRKCPRELECMRSITPEMALEKIEAKLEKGA